LRTIAADAGAGAGVTNKLNLLIRLAVSAGAVLLAGWISQNWNLGLLAVGDWTTVGGWTVALVFAIVLGILNALLRPILLLVTCPLNFITLGLFTFVVNAVVFWLAANLVSGVTVNGFLGALFGSLIVTVCTAIADRSLEQ
jgi:putative membrane protein